jgi:hypothetical protein
MIQGNTMEPFRCWCSNGEVIVLSAKDGAMAKRLATLQCPTGIVLKVEAVNDRS